MTPSILFSLFILLIVLILCLIILISKVFYIQVELEHLSDLVEKWGHTKPKEKPRIPPKAPEVPKSEEPKKHSDISMRFATFPCPSCDYVHVINEKELPARRDCPSCGQTVEVDK